MCTWPSIMTVSSENWNKKKADILHSRPLLIFQMLNATSADHRERCREAQYLTSSINYPSPTSSWATHCLTEPAL